MGVKLIREGHGVVGEGNQSPTLFRKGRERRVGRRRRMWTPSTVT